ncbi:hypothetical protein HAX54_003852 [Datura stramonium]|uniref:Uncharacterized protein n=1 Tax=Datura stramonium TaxID=4076 RepID=A0ABS8WSH2_DATST|nr:hypothetical protein [Datura stramonium]
MDRSVRSVRNQNVQLTPKMGLFLSSRSERNTEGQGSLDNVGGRLENGEKWREQRMFGGDRGLGVWWFNERRRVENRGEGGVGWRRGEKRREVRWFSVHDFTEGEERRGEKREEGGRAGSNGGHRRDGRREKMGGGWMVRGEMGK